MGARPFALAFQGIPSYHRPVSEYLYSLVLTGLIQLTHRFVSLTSVTCRSAYYYVCSRLTTAPNLAPHFLAQEVLPCIGEVHS